MSQLTPPRSAAAARNARTIGRVRSGKWCSPTYAAAAAAIRRAAVGISEQGHRVRHQLVLVFGHEEVDPAFDAETRHPGRGRDHRHLVGEGLQELDLGSAPGVEGHHGHRRPVIERLEVFDETAKPHARVGRQPGDRLVPRVVADDGGGDGEAAAPSHGGQDGLGQHLRGEGVRRVPEIADEEQVGCRVWRPHQAGRRMDGVGENAHADSVPSLEGGGVIGRRGGEAGERRAECGHQPSIGGGLGRVSAGGVERLIVVIEVEGGPRCAEPLGHRQPERSQVGAKDVHRDAVHRPQLPHRSRDLGRHRRRCQPGGPGQRRRIAEPSKPGGIGEQGRHGDTNGRE